MRSMTRWLAMTVMVFGLCSSAWGSLINVKFQHLETSNPDPGYTGPGIVGKAGDFWNLVLANSNIGGYNVWTRDSAGKETVGADPNIEPGGIMMDCNPQGMSLSTTIPNFTDSSYDLLMRGYLTTTATGEAPDLIKFSNLPANSPFDLYLYSQPESSTLPLYVSVNGSIPVTIDGDSSLTAFVQGGNYEKFSTTSDANGELLINVFADYNFGSAAINALQLQSVSSPAAVPEPSTYALLALGFGGMMFVRRRK